MSSPHTPGTFADYLVGALQRWPDRIAFDDLEHEYTYRHIADLVSRTMSLFAKDGGIRRVGIGILSGNAVPTWITAAAAKLSGGYVVSLPVRGSSEDLAFIANDGGISILVVHQDLAHLGAEVLKNSPNVKRVYTVGISDLGPDLITEAEKQPSVNLRPVRGIQHGDICEIKYTGGTTGIPKGAVHTHWSTLVQTLSIQAGIQLPPGARYLCSGPMSHSGYPWIAPTLFGGGTVILNKTFEPELFVKTVQQKRASFVMAVPTMIYKILSLTASRDVDFSSIKCFMYGASPMSPTRLAEAHERFGQVFVQVYGCVEALGMGTILPPALHDLARPDRLISCGMPLPSVTVGLLDADGEEVAEGKIGELCVRTPAVMKEYWNRPEETEQAFAHGWLHTGDLATRNDEGLYTIVDRMKDVIVTGGFNVFASQVESVISADPSVQSVAVIAVPDDLWGEAVKAVVVAAPGHVVDTIKIQALVRAKKGSVNTPKSVDVVAELPLTNAGKINKFLLREQYWKGAARYVN